MSTNTGLNLQPVPNMPHWDNPVRHYITVNLSKWRIWLDALLAEYQTEWLNDEQAAEIVQKINAYLYNAECKCENMIYVYFEASNKSLRYQKQCMQCYRITNQIQKISIPSTTKIYPRAELNRRELWEAVKGIRDEMTGIIESHHRKDFFVWYQEYLFSSQWKEKARQVLTRDDGQCKAILSGCLRSANQVHHLSYQHVGNEPLFELISVCSACHDKITTMDRDRKNGSSA